MTLKQMVNLRLSNFRAEYISVWDPAEVCHMSHTVFHMSSRCLGEGHQIAFIDDKSHSQYGYRQHVETASPAAVTSENCMKQLGVLSELDFRLQWGQLKREVNEMNFPWTESFSVLKITAWCKKKNALTYFHDWMLLCLGVKWAGVTFSFAV